MVKDGEYASQIDDHSENTLNNHKRLRKRSCKISRNYSSKVSSKSTRSSESQNVCPHSKDSVDPQDMCLHSDDSSVPHVILCDSSDEKTLCCTYCSFKGDTLASIKKHISRHSFIYHICGNDKKLYLDTDLYLHLNNKHPDKQYYYCDLCSAEFVNVSSIVNHRKLCMNSQSFVCQFCRKIFSEIISFKQHESTHEEIRNLYA